jgi:hypothetical protein
VVAVHELGERVLVAGAKRGHEPGLVALPEEPP